MFILNTLLSGIGSALGIAGELSGANRRENVAGINYAIESQNARMERDNTLLGLQFQRFGNRLALDTARSNYRLSLAEAEARERNAERIRLTAEARADRSRTAIARRKREFEGFAGTQRSRIASSGVAFEGSALDVLTETAGQMAIALEDMADEANFERDQGMDAAAMERFSATLGRAGAAINFQSAKRGHRLNMAANRMGRVSARQRYSANMFSAEMSRLGQLDTASGQRMGAIGSVFAGAAGFLNQRDTYQRNIALSAATGPTYQATA